MRYRPSDDVIVEEQGGDAFLLHVPTARYFGLNQTGILVWQSLDAGVDPFDRLRDRHPSITEDRLRADVDHLLEQLLDAGLIVAES